MSSLYLNYDGPAKVKKETGVKCLHLRKYHKNLCIRCYAKKIGAVVKKAESWNNMEVAKLR